MSRTLRPNLPGSPFHITARTQDQAFFFAEPSLRDHIVLALASSLCRTDALLIAFGVMTNHLHLVVSQGRRPLAALMQPFLRRVSARVRRHCKVDGHVFSRPFFAAPCADVDHLRTAIAYVHHNPVDALICQTSDEYSWTSHALYAGIDCSPVTKQLALTRALGAYATSETDDVDVLIEDYRRFFADYCRRRRAEPGSEPLPPYPLYPAAVAYWAKRFGRPSAKAPDARVDRPDLRDIARHLIRERLPEASLEDLISSRGSHAFSALRREIVLAALAVDYGGSTIARFLHISAAAVSIIRARAIASATTP